VSKKNKIALLFLLSANVVVGMIIDRVISLPQEVQGIIVQCLQGGRQWWYCAQIYDHNSCVNSVSWNNDGTHIATGSDDTKARIFDVKTGRLVACFDHNNWVRSVSWNPAGTHVATGSFDKKARIFEVKTGQLVNSFEHNCMVNSVSWNPAGTHVATASEDQVRIFNAITGQLVNSFAHNCTVTSVSWNHDGTYLATGLNDGKAQIFDVSTGRVVACFDYGDCFLKSVRCNHDGTHLATGSGNGKVRIFKHHKNATIAQLMLRYVFFNTWLLIEKPDKNTITTPELLLSDVAGRYQLNHQHLVATWNTFPEPMRDAIWRTMRYRIEKYGKSTTPCTIQQIKGKLSE
jgi:WD40 repeat protein